MINIKLDEKMSIVSDSNQYILRQYKGMVNDKEGNEKESFEAIGYFPTMRGALNDYIENSIRESNCTTIKELIELNSKLEAKIDNLIKF